MTTDRDKLAYELRESGLKLREIGERLGGISASRARDLARRWERKQSRPPDLLAEDALQHGVTTKVLNAYRCMGYSNKAQIERAVRENVKVPNVATTGLTALRKWLGLSDMPKKEVSPIAIRAAITLLERSGYMVDKK